MQTQIRIRKEKTKRNESRQYFQYLGLLLLGFVLTACGQDSSPQQSVISDNKLSTPLPEAITPFLTGDKTSLVVDVVLNGDINNPFRIENLHINTPAMTFSGNVPKFPVGTSTVSLVYSINDPAQGMVEIIRTSNITVNVVANEDTPADFSSTEMTYTDTDEDSISNMDELKTGTDVYTANYTVGGQIEGLTGSGLLLQNNDGDDLAINAEGDFTFSNTVTSGSNYTVTVLTQPGNPDQTCTVSNGSGTISDTAVSSVNVICNTNTAPIATNVTITNVNGGNTAVGNRLNGDYTYADAENDTEDASTFRWLANGVAIAEATTTSYVPAASDEGKTITFEVTPVAITGITTGSAASSDGLLIMNSAPVFTSGAAVNMAENTTVTGYTATATDIDGDTVTFSLSGGTDQGVFSIDSNNGVLSFSVAPDFEIRIDSDGNNTYEVEITATDGTHPVVRSVTVTVTDILEVSVSAANIKTIRFEWSAYAGATNYKLFVNPDGVSGFGLLQDNLPDTGTTITLPVHLTDWINARYILEAHDASGKLTTSSPVSITTLMLSSIGYVTASNTEKDELFGWTVSLSGDGNTLAVGAHEEASAATGVSTDGSGETDNTANWSGAVYVFKRNGRFWKQQAYVKASNTEAGDFFGWAVSLSADGNTLAVGANEEDSDGSGETDNTAPDSGAAYVFSRSDGVWSQQAYIKASNTGTGYSFGDVVSLSSDGNTLAVGAHREGSPVSEGAVYVFSRNGNVWEQQAYVKASDTKRDAFGSTLSLSADGSTLAVGAFGEDSAATGISINGSGEYDNTANNAGAVYLFSRSGSVWEQQAYIKASNAEAGDWFGWAVSLSANGNTLAVGARDENSAATGISTDGSGEADNTAKRSGAVYVFSRNNGFWWEQQAYIKASNAEADDSFGSAVNLSADGNMLAVGAVGENSASTGISIDGSGETDNTSGDGAVYIFSRNGGIWSQQTYVKASNTGGGSFGQAVSLSSDGATLAVGAPTEDGIDDTASDAGAIYLY